MRKRLLTVLAISVIALTACTSSDNTTTEGEATTQKATSASKEEQSNVANVGDNGEADADSGVYAVIPKDFIEAVRIEDTYRKAISQDISKVEKDAAQTEAIEAMLQLKDSYAEKINEKLNTEQKNHFEGYLNAENEFNAYFDMISQNAISAYVYTGGSASASETYNLVRLETVKLYYYSNLIDGTEIDETTYKEIVNANLDEFMFFADTDFDWNQDNTAGIYEESKTALTEYISEDSRRAISEYDAAYKKFETAFATFEQSVGMEASDCYVSLNAAIFSTLNESIKALAADDTLSHFVKETNLESDKEEFMNKWNYTAQANGLNEDQLAAARTVAEEYYAGTVMEVPRTISLRLTEDIWEVTGEGY